MAECHAIPVTLDDHFNKRPVYILRFTHAHKYTTYSHYVYKRVLYATRYQSKGDTMVVSNFPISHSHIYQRDIGRISSSLLALERTYFQWIPSQPSSFTVCVINISVFTLPPLELVLIIYRSYGTTDKQQKRKQDTETLCLH